VHERFDVGPEVRNQSGGVALAIGPNTAQPVFVILLGPPFVTHLMGIVGSHQPGAIGSVHTRAR